MDRQWEQAVEAGKKNQRTMTLVQNWCAHARIENHGGVGLIQMHTGLPIGHLAMVCDYATSGSMMAAWDLADAALEFHDHNCVGCKHRKPVRLPNLSGLVAARDASVRAQEARAAAYDLAQADALRKRQAARYALTSKLPPASRSLVEHLDALDTGSGQDAGKALEVAAGLAPDAFTPELVDHLFALAEGEERWAMETALVILDKIGASPDRLANVAARSLAKSGDVRSAEIMVRHLHHVRKDLIGRTVPALIDHAAPDDFPFGGHNSNPDPQYLLAVHKAFSAEVERVVDDLLGASPAAMGAGARAVAVLGKSVPTVALKFARTVISKLARTNWEDDFDSHLSRVKGALRRAAALAFRFDPVATEKLIDGFRLGASPAAHKELGNIYQWVLRRDDDREGAPFDPGERAAFDRMIALASNPPSKEVEKELGDFFAHASREFRELAAEKIDALLGAAALLADMLDRLDAQYKATPAPDFLTQLERNNRRSGLVNLQSNLAELAAEAAAGDPERTRKFLSLLSSVPAERAGLRHALIDHLDELITSPETLAEILPYLYSALVGASVLERAAGAAAIGKIQSKLLEDAPPLLLEAFVALLSDQYLYPVSEAVKALERMRLPDGLKVAVRLRLWSIIMAYAKTANQQPFLVQAIETVAARFLSDAQLGGRAGAAIVDILEPHDVTHYYQELRHLAHHFKRQPKFGRLVVKALLEPNYRHFDGTVALLRDLPAATVVANAAALEGLVEALNLERGDWQIGQVLVEAFTRAGLWEQTLCLIDAMIAKIADVPRNRRQHIHLAMVRAAIEVEWAVAQGKLDEVAALGKAWRETAKQSLGEGDDGE